MTPAPQSPPSRYDFVKMTGSVTLLPAPRDDGEWVKYADHKAIVAEKDREIERLTRERDEAFAANERDRSIIADARNAFSDALKRRTWLLQGRGSYEWDDDRWKDEFRQAIGELEAPMDVLSKIGVDWSLCPTSPEEIAAARIDWKDRATTAERERDEARAEVERLQLLLTPFANVAAALGTDAFDDAYKPTGRDVLPAMGDYRRAYRALNKEQGK